MLKWQYSGITSVLDISMMRNTWWWRSAWYGSCIIILIITLQVDSSEKTPHTLLIKHHARDSNPRHFSYLLCGDRRVAQAYSIAWSITNHCSDGFCWVKKMMITVNINEQVFNRLNHASWHAMNQLTQESDDLFMVVFKSSPRISLFLNNELAWTSHVMPIQHKIDQY